MEEILHQLIGSLAHYLQGCIHARWWRISSINSMSGTPKYHLNSLAVSKVKNILEFQSHRLQCLASQTRLAGPSPVVTIYHMQGEKDKIWALVIGKIWLPGECPQMPPVFYMTYDIFFPGWPEEKEEISGGTSTTRYFRVLLILSEVPRAPVKVGSISCF